MKRALFLPIIYSILLIVLLFSCEGITSKKGDMKDQDQQTQADGEHKTADGFLSGDPDENGLEAENQNSRGLDMSLARMSDFTFEKEFPLLYEACKSDPQLIRGLDNYAKKVLSKEQQSEQDLLSLMEQRDSSLIPFMAPMFENMNAEKLDQNWGEYQEELKRLGMTMTAAEGMFTSIGSAPFLEDKIKELGSKEFQAYVAFLNAMTESRNGEYPFQNMRPFRDMVLAGETVMEGDNAQYKKQIDDAFQYALEAFTDVHFVSSPGTRQVGVALVGGTSTDPYPSLAELETAKDFVKSSKESKYKKALSEILRNPSEISEKPENIYVIVINWEETKKTARMRVRSHLAAGEDVPHYLKIRRGDGTDQYAISYRFFEDEDKANSAFDEAIKEFPDAQLIYCSVKGDQLYQLGI